MYASETSIRVRYAETDQMGVVYHANYFAWLEVGRVHMLDEIGLPYTEMEKNGIMLPVIELEAKYMGSARFDDIVTIRSFMAKVPSVRFDVTYELLVKDKLIATARTRHAFVTLEGAPTRPPAYIITRFREIFEKIDTAKGTE